MALELILAAESSSFMPFIFSLWNVTMGPLDTTAAWVGEGTGLFGEDVSFFPSVSFTRPPAEERRRPPSPPTFLGWPGWEGGAALVAGGEDPADSSTLDSRRGPLLLPSRGSSLA